ncbi:hypothetical protein E0H93_26425 [Rhizobium leguminosarum bv. viciae]|uniref:hypothetical protein n=1 Tax=Rhizobium leguminosarum TaxID=384 RepID=UPI00103FE50B|nr:hypothetical protein [Rhizobium leguminosarum]TBY30133.1 hypothetical protein E0H55_21880 [Rhizobium leguminosarum bv. viciae]TCB00996.1 hypothetical protein E0H93_26425 [Rhizobium leguminosarum bv. viciae]
MTMSTLTTLKFIAKRLARAQRLQHIAALEIIARQLGKANWRGLAEAYKQGWRPASDQVESLESSFRDHEEAFPAADAGQNSDLSAFGNRLVFTRWEPDHVKPMEADEIHGELDGYAFYLAATNSASPSVRRVGRSNLTKRRLQNRRSDVWVDASNPPKPSTLNFSSTPRNC